MKLSEEIVKQILDKKYVDIEDEENGIYLYLEFGDENEINYIEANKDKHKICFTETDFSRHIEYKEDFKRSRVHDDCPNCGVPFTYHYNYCPKCGQILKWETEE